MKEQKKILESYLREVILSELKIKDSFKRELKNFWHSLKNKTYKALEKRGVDTRSLRRNDYYNYYDYEDENVSSRYKKYYSQDETDNLIKSLVNSWYNQVSNYSNFKFSEDRKETIESCKMIYKDSLRQGKNPQQAMDNVFKYLAKVSR